MVVSSHGVAGTHRGARGVSIGRRCGGARGKRNSVLGGGALNGAQQRALQVILRVGMGARKSGAGQTQNGFYLCAGHTAAEQGLSNPQIGDAPIRMGKALWNAQIRETGLINRRRSSRIGCRIVSHVGKWRYDRTTEVADADPTRLGAQTGGDQSIAVGRQTGLSLLESDPGRPSVRQSALWFSIGESSQSSDVAPVGAGPIAVIELSQAASDLSGQCRRQRLGTDSNPSLPMTGTGFGHHTRCMTVGAHGGNHRWRGIIQIDQNISGVSLAGVRTEINLKPLPVARPQKSQDVLIQQLGCRPQPLARKRSSGMDMDQADRISGRRHGGELMANSLKGQKESSIQHRENVSHPTALRGRGLAPRIILIAITDSIELKS